MYKIMVDCQLNQGASDDSEDQPAGFFTVKIETGNETEARLGAIARTKNQMIEKGYSLAEVESSTFSIEEIELIQNLPDNRDFEQSFIYYPKS